MAERLGATPQGRLRPRTSDETFCYASARFAHDGRVRPCILVDSAAHTRDSGRASSMKEFLLFSSLIYGSLFVGWVLRQWIPALILRFTIMAVSTPLILLVYWDMDATLFRTYFPIALAALVVLSVSGLAGYLITRLIGGDRAARGAFVVSSMFSNIGSILGGFLCMLYLGDEGLVVSQIFVLLTFPFYFTVVFAVARRFAGGAPMGIWQATRANFKDPLAGLPLMAVIVGLTLGLSGVDFPGVFQLPRRILVFTAVILFSLSFGLTARFRPMLRRAREYLAILPVKFVVAPLTGLAVASLFGYTLAATPLAFKVIVIQSAMPVATLSVAAAKLFRLDEQLALGLWIFTTLCVAGLVPAIAWLAGL